ncbi:hypothetical protein [Mycolicibacterium psychrotolerans]|nr:hypothetical protein [Mycolicibacterium psychrotolerans]
MTEVFLGREALGDGLPRHELRRWYKQMFRGVYLPKNATPTFEDRALGAWLTSDRQGVIAGAAASALHGARWVDVREPIELLVAERRRQPGLVIRMDRFRDDEVTTLAGMPVTTAARTAFDLGRHQPRALALGRLDALMRAAPYGLADVQRLIDRYGPVRGVRQLRELLPIVDGGAESLPESRLRLLLIDHGFAAPETQIAVSGGDGFTALLDMGWRDLRLAVEYDGAHHQSDRVQYLKDRRRLPGLMEREWEVLTFVNEDTPREVIARTYEAYVRRGGAEIDALAWVTRSSAPNRRFGREGGDGWAA